MMLGKRPRPPMRRTTSIAEFEAEIGVGEHQPQKVVPAGNWLQQRSQQVVAAGRPRGGGGGGGAAHRRNSGDFMVVETAPFLRACGLCKRRLGPERDIFMYRGEIAFCSLECRQQQMNHDEHKEKCSLSSIKKDSSPAAATGSDSSSGSSGGETLAPA